MKTLYFLLIAKLGPWESKPLLNFQVEYDIFKDRHRGQLRYYNLEAKKSFPGH